MWKRVGLTMLLDDDHRDDDRRRVEDDLAEHLPDRLDVSQVDEQRRQQHRDSGRKITSSATINGSSSQLSIGRTPAASAKISHHDQVQAEVEEREHHDRERDHQPRKLDLAHERLVVDDASHRAHGRLGEEREQHDRSRAAGRRSSRSWRPRPLPTWAICVKKTYSTRNSSSGLTSCHR